MEAGGDKPKKGHKKAHAGRKAKKKKDKQNGKVERHNPRAFTFSGGTRSVQKKVLHTMERQAKKDHAPKVDKTPEVPPPFIVVVQGPPGVGKTTLVHSLVKHYAKQKLLRLRGPITLVSGRQRRLTIVECPQDMASMLDLAKIADLVLLLIDASFGFELETFEFINILQVHGFPRVIGVLTHLDGFRENKQLRKVKKTMKNRFWSEIYDGAKLFYLSGMQYGRYHRVEIQNLVRFIAVTKNPILSWRQNHPYLLGLRWEDKTPPTEPESAPRTLDLYGYVCGGRLREGVQAHLAGIGDFQIAAIKALPDPCPPPANVEADRQKAKDTIIGKDGKPRKKNTLRTLAERHRLVYAPGCDIGSITVDSEAMYIHLPEHEVGFTPGDGEKETGKELPDAVRWVRALQSGDAALKHTAAARPDLRLVGNSTVRLAETSEEIPRTRRLAPIGDDDDAQKENDNVEDNSDSCDEEKSNTSGEEDEDSNEKHRQDVLERARKRFEQASSLAKVVYGTPTPLSAGATNNKDSAGSKKDGRNVHATHKPTDHATVSLFDESDDDNDAKTQSLHGDLFGNFGDIDGVDTSCMMTLPNDVVSWDDETKESLKTRKFITGGWSSEEEDNDKAELDATKAEGPGAVGDSAGAAGDGDNAQGMLNGTSGVGFDTFLDSMPIATFVRVRLEGVPAACVAEMRLERPLVLGGLLPGESKLGMTQVRIKRHRWHPKLLKSGDALLISVGWRRFQSLPSFSLEDRGEKRMRYLKYTLEHAHCTMTTYCPMVPPNTGVLAFRTWDKVGHFRICGTGGVLESAPDFAIVKKLKLVGEPYKIFKNTAFVRNMFNSDLEVNKYSHTKIQTVSGIRGEIKKAESTRGNFRATFEDRILMSDIVVCKCWVNVEPKKFYHPVLDVTGWRPMRLIGELRANAGVAVPHEKDSQYGKQIIRPERKFNPLKIPKALEEALPFKSKPKLKAEKKLSPLRKKTAMVLNDREKSINALIGRLNTVRREKMRIRVQANAKKKVIKEKQEQFIQNMRDEYSREARKKRYIGQGQQEQRRRKVMRLE